MADPAVYEVEEETEYLEEEEDGQADAGEELADTAMSSLKEVQDKSFEEVRLPEDVLAEAQQAWTTFINSASSREAAGEAIYAALFDSAPSLQGLFKTPRSVMAMRFMNGLNSIIFAASNPTALKVQVETLGFQHLDLEVTVPRVAIFRDAIIDLFDAEMGDRFTNKAKLGFLALLNYVGGAYIFIRREYADRIKIIKSSWRTANNKAADVDAEEVEDGRVGEEDGRVVEDGEGEEGKEGEAASVSADVGQGGAAEARASGEAKNSKNTKVPTTFNEMFLFNGAVMGFGSSSWMQPVLEQFDDIVMNVANSYRLQEECDVLSLVLAKYNGTINLSEFKAVMLSSLRSLVPKDWDSSHEVAWGWLWENVERMLRNLMGKPQVQEKALERLIMSLTEDAVNFLRREVYKQFFALAPAGQDYFKQSTTRLYFIADKIVEMTIEMYRGPRKMVEDISALGLRHVGYAIPTEFFAPFVSGAVNVVRTMTTDEVAEEAFRWSLTLISKILVRTILEGSTIVMKAINTNQEKALAKAVSVAPRGERAKELLNIVVGTQSISPFYWAIESGSLNCAKAMINDLLTIRADRDNYYYGCDDLFGRHPEVIQRLCADAANLLWPLLDGLIWRSRLVAQGQRRVNYYVKHLIQDNNGNLDPALGWLAEHGDPEIISHPVVVLFSDIIWDRLAKYHFLLGRCYFLFTLLVFITSQSILSHLHEGYESFEEHVAIFACRCFIYLGSMCKLWYSQSRLLALDFKKGNFVKIAGVPLPEYLLNFQEAGNLFLAVTLILMATQEPIIWCAQNTHGDFPGSGIFTTSCPEAKDHKDIYSAFSCVAMLAYWALLTDFTIFSMRISSFLLVCFRVISELGLFLMAMTFLVVAFATSISCLNNSLKDFAGVDKGALSLFEMTLNMYPTSHFEAMQEEVWVLTAVAVFVIITAILLLNLLIAQLNQAYQNVFHNMQGYARLNRAAVTVAMVEQVSQKRWGQFLASLKLEERLEFNEGDVGLAGGIQVQEPPNANPTTVDAIRRFGGSTSPTMPWPEEDGMDTGDDDKFERLEKLIVRASKNAGAYKRKKGGGSSSLGNTSSEGTGTGDEGQPEVSN